MPPPVAAAPVPEKAPPEPDDRRRSSSLSDHWKRDKLPISKRASDKERYVELFVSRFGDRPAGQVTPLVVCDVRDSLLPVPAQYPEAVRNASLDALPTWRSKPDNAGCKTLHRTTTAPRVSVRFRW